MPLNAINWVSHPDPATPIASRQERYNEEVIRAGGDPVSVPQRSYQSIIMLEPSKRLTLDYLIIGLNKFFPHWKGIKSSQFRFGKGGLSHNPTDVCCLIDIRSDSLIVRILAVASG